MYKYSIIALKIVKETFFSTINGNIENILCSHFL